MEVREWTGLVYGPGRHTGACGRGCSWPTHRVRPRRDPPNWSPSSHNHPPTRTETTDNAGLPTRPQTGRQLWRRAILQLVVPPAPVPRQHPRPPGWLRPPGRNRRHEALPRGSAPLKRQGVPSRPLVLPSPLALPCPRATPRPLCDATAWLTAPPPACRSPRPTSSSRPSARASSSSRPSSSSPSCAAWWGCAPPTPSPRASSSWPSTCGGLPVNELDRRHNSRAGPHARADPLAVPGRGRRDLLLGPAAPRCRDGPASQLEQQRQPRAGRQARVRGAPSLALRTRQRRAHSS